MALVYGVLEVSYCRWSTRCFDCDLYVYEGVDNLWHIHVAGNRRYSDSPRPTLPENYTPQDAIDYHMACGEWTKASELRPIGLPHDCESFAASTAEEAAATVAYLGEQGYRFPDWLIDSILEDGDGRQI